METRRCTLCHEEKPLTEFHRHFQNGRRPRCKSCRSIEAKQRYDPDYHRAYYAQNGDQMRERNRQWRAANPDRKRAIDKAYRELNKPALRSKTLLRNYGITLQQWEEMFEAQGRACRICGSLEPKNKRGWHTDHGVIVRGILCHHCNTGLGAFNHDVRQLRAAIRYLSK